MWLCDCLWHNSISRVDREWIITSNIAELSCHSWKLWKTSRWPRYEFVNLFGIVRKQLESAVIVKVIIWKIPSSWWWWCVSPHWSVSSLQSQVSGQTNCQSKKSAESSLLPVNKVYEDGFFLNFKDFPTGQPARRVSANRDVKVWTCYSR